MTTNLFNKSTMNVSVVSNIHKQLQGELNITKREVDGESLPFFIQRPKWKQQQPK